MKVLFHVDHSFAWAHGGVQNLVEHLLKFLPIYGVDAEPLRWWDASQHGDILHVFYKPGAVIELAKQKGLKIVANIFLDNFSSMNRTELFVRRVYINAFKKIFRNNAVNLGWFYGEVSDAYVYPSEHEAVLGKYLFNAKPEKSFTVLHGVDDQYFSDETNDSRRSNYLVAIGTISQRKNNLQLAKIAKKARVPIVFLGKPYGENSYFDEFRSLIDDEHVIYKGFVDEDSKRILLKEARGFVTLSRVESGCIAVLEALASNCPVFLPNLPWAKSIYDGYAEFGELEDEKELVSQLRRFYEAPFTGKTKFRVSTWNVATEQYIKVYEKALASTSRVFAEA